ncbi:hypothetical protein B0H21DRAFT_879963 [Amylocystis lapponica]|nr:hypothetical protein B0H21DRAFT_879963 [Amylocystis lapponica]
MDPNSYLHAIRPALPASLARGLDALPDTLVPHIDTLLRLVLGAPCPEDASPAEWSRSQHDTATLIDRLKAANSAPASRKRPPSSPAPAPGPSPKRTRSSPTPPPDPPLFTLHALSLTAPLRKKADITVHRASVRLTDPSTHAPAHAPLPLPALRHAFLLPTRARPRPHWSVLLLPASPTAPQLAFGLDAAPAALSTTAHAPDSPARTSHPKGAPALPALRTFLALLPVPTLEPDPAVFRSAARDAAAGVDAYRGAKQATLWFLDAGVLWDGRPAEFWALADLAHVRTASATGRTCSVLVARAGADAEDTDFAMVDGKEREGIVRWADARRRRFGRRDPSRDAPPEPEPEAGAAEDASDADDSDFEDDASSDGGSATGSSSDSRSAASDGEAQASDRLGSESGADDRDADAELDPEHHPLLRPGAMPRMSRAALDAVVGMMEEDMMGGGGRAMAEASESDEEDQLDD